MEKILENSSPDGVHFLIEFFGCEEKQLNNIEFWKKTFKEGCHKSHIPVLGEYFYSFQPNGLTGFFLLASSHISVHTWPEYNYAACDVFSCSPENQTKKLVNFLTQNVLHANVSIKKIKRGYKFFNLQKIINERNELVVPILSTGKKMEIKVKEVIGKIKSDFQDILFLDTFDFGRCLVIDGLMQITEKDHKIYDEHILKSLTKKDRSLLVLGGGDGYVAETALGINQNLKVKIIDVDIEIFKGCEKHLDQKVFKDKRVRLHIEDVFNYLKNTAGHKEKFDGIVCDLTDELIRKRDQKSFNKFYEEIIELSKNALNDDGWISFHAGASRVTFGRMNTAMMIKKLLQKNFVEVFQSDKLIPSFGEKNAFLFARKDKSLGNKKNSKHAFFFSWF